MQHNPDPIGQNLENHIKMLQGKDYTTIYGFMEFLGEDSTLNRLFDRSNTMGQ